MVRGLVAMLLFTHGLIHVGFLSPPPASARAAGPPWPFRLDRSWLLVRFGVRSDVMVTVGRALVAGIVLVFSVAAVGLMARTSWWLPAAVVGAGCSAVQLTLWFHSWLPIGLLLDVALIAAAITRWPMLDHLV